MTRAFALEALDIKLAEARRLAERDRRYAANNPDALAPTRGRVPAGHTGTIRDTWSRWH